jgi:hypothetical protein
MSRPLPAGLPPVSVPEGQTVPPHWTQVLTHAGAYGALRGGHPGHPELGLSVPVQTGSELALALNRLAELDQRATLLVPPALAAEHSALLAAAAEAGHQLAGFGSLSSPLTLDLLTGGQLQAWALDAPTLPELARLRRLDLALLPVPRPSPEPGAVMRLSPRALDTALQWRALGYRLMPVRELRELRAATPRDLAIHAYRERVDARFAQAHGVVDLALRADAVMRVAAHPSPAGLPYPAGSPGAELHLHSAKLVGLASRSSLVAYRAFQRSLRDVGAALNTRPELQGAQVVYAATLFLGPLTRNGFELVPLPPLRARLYGAGFHFLRMLYGSHSELAAPEAQLAWMARSDFLARFG